MQKFPKFSQVLSEDPTTRRIWYGIATAHDLEAHDNISESSLYSKIFASHFGHLAIIFIWTTGNLFHIAKQGNFDDWILNPLKVKPLAHSIWDPHFNANVLNSVFKSGSNICYSGLYNLLYTVGIRKSSEISIASGICLAISVLFLVAAWFHTQNKNRINILWFKNNESRLNHHLAGLFGLSSLAWSGHLVHIALPRSRGSEVTWDNFFQALPHPAGLEPLFSLKWNEYAMVPDTSSHIFNSNIGAGTAILTFNGGLHKQTESLFLTDIIHHHLAIGILFIVAGHMYKTCFGIGHSIRQILQYHTPPSKSLGDAHRNLYDTITNSLHLQLCFALAALGVACSLTAQHIYTLNPYAFLSRNYTTQAALYTHHQYIAGFLMIGAFAHGAIFLVKDYDPYANKNNVLARILDHKEAIISHLSGISLFLGFHTLGIYTHNDVVVALGQPEKQILIEPLFAEWIQAASGKTEYGIYTLLSDTTSSAYKAATNLWLSDWLNNINSTKTSPFLSLDSGDFLAHHAIALGLHVTTLILVKGALDARGSRLMPDKKDFGYSFPCDGPGRGGTCDISAWDSFYLSMFWMLNTIGWTTFYWHWKHLTLWQNASQQFDEASNTLMGWLRDYLWFNSSPLINGYNNFGTNSLSAWSWMFLFGHLVWATGFMFLISWRGYWQELIETLVWAHQRTPVANLIQWRDKPVALSIIQARLIGLVHFTVGYIFTYAPFVIASTAAKFS